MIVTARLIILSGVLALASSAMTLAAAAQSAPEQLGVAPAAEPPATAPAPAQPLQIHPGQSSRAGVFSAIGRWFDDSIDTMTSGWNSTVGSIGDRANDAAKRSEEHTSELQSLRHLVCRLL